jgi:hypothetical protein
MNYSQLVQAITDYTENTETTFVSNIPLFVRQAEERIYRTVMIPELRKNVTANMTASNRFLARPSDFLAPFSIAVIDADGDYTFLIDKDVNFIREAFPSIATTGLPKYYAEFDGDIESSNSPGHFILGPTPDAIIAFSCITTLIRLQLLNLAHLGWATTQKKLCCMEVSSMPISS